MTKILVTYYSRTGFTRTVAKHIAQACDADLEGISEEAGWSRRLGALGSVRPAIDAALHVNVPLRKPRHAPSDYDLIVIGTPIWLWNACSPVRSYVEKHREQFHSVAFFCTSGGSGHSKVLKDLEALSAKRSVASLAITEAEISGNQSNNRLANFAARIKRTSQFDGRTRLGERA